MNDWITFSSDVSGGTPLAGICLFLCLKSPTYHPGVMYLASYPPAKLDVYFACGQATYPPDGANTCSTLSGQCPLGSSHPRPKWMVHVLLLLGFPRSGLCPPNAVSTCSTQRAMPQGTPHAHLTWLTLAQSLLSSKLMSLCSPN